jgi:hypothetical protein
MKRKSVWGGENMRKKQNKRPRTKNISRLETGCAAWGSNKRGDPELQNHSVYPKPQIIGKTGLRNSAGHPKEDFETTGLRKCEGEKRIKIRLGLTPDYS